MLKEEGKYNLRNGFSNWSSNNVPSVQLAVGWHPRRSTKVTAIPKKSDCDEFNWLWDNNTHCFTDLYFFDKL